MPYAMCPDTGNSRLYRYVLEGDLATLDATNLLVINKSKFDALTAGQQHRLLRTHRIGSIAAHQL